MADQVTQDGNKDRHPILKLIAALESTRQVMRDLRGRAFIGSHIPRNQEPLLLAADEAERLAAEALTGESLKEATNVFDSLWRLVPPQNWHCQKCARQFHYQGDCYICNYCERLWPADQIVQFGYADLTR